MTRHTTLAATVTVLLGLGAFLVADTLRAETRLEEFDLEPVTFGPLEAINGAPFPRERGRVVVTEPLAHVRLPTKRLLLGKHLVVRPRFHLDEADVLEVGVKKTAFWLDYDRRPLQHRGLDTLLVRDEDTWSALRSGHRIAYVNPQYQNPWKTLEAFEADPPTEGPVGLYGHAHLPTPNTLHPTPTTSPFRLTDDPDDFRAIYAFYPEADATDPEWTVNEQRFDLAKAYRNEDGSIELMFFLQRRDDAAIRALFDSLELRFEPGLPNARDLALAIRRNVVRLVRRPAAQP